MTDALGHISRQCCSKGCIGAADSRVTVVAIAEALLIAMGGYSNLVCSSIGIAIKLCGRL